MGEDGATPEVESEQSRAGLQALVDGYQNDVIAKKTDAFSEEETALGFLGGDHVVDGVVVPRLVGVCRVLLGRHRLGVGDVDHVGGVLAVVFLELALIVVEQLLGNLFLERLDTRLADQGMKVELTDAAKNLLADRGYDPVLGARPLRRTIQRDIEDVLAEKILFGEVKPGQIVVVDAASEGSDEPFVFKGTERSELPDEVPEELTSSAGENNDGQ